MSILKFLIFLQIFIIFMILEVFLYIVLIRML